MPYKERLKTGNPRKRKKTQYKVENWTEYNQSLKNRGALSLYFPKGDLKSILYNENSYVEGVSGRTVEYNVAYIQLIYTFYRLFDWGLRQMTGYFEDMWASKDLDIPVPSFGTLSDVFAGVPVEVKQFCDQVAARLQRGEKISLIVDSTGFSFPRSRDWFEKTYGEVCAKKPWRKMHLSIDPEMNTHAIKVTEHTISDQEIMEKLIPEDLRPFVDKLLGDGGYYDHEKSQALMNEGITPAIPPPKTSVVQGKDSTAWHDLIVSYIQEKGSIYAFHKKYGYGLRALVEAHFSRIKRCIGESFKTIKIDSQQREAITIANILNLWNSFGKPVSVKIG
jgi:hypothetical protein